MLGYNDESGMPPILKELTVHCGVFHWGTDDFDPHFSRKFDNVWSAQDCRTIKACRVQRVHRAGISRDVCFLGRSKVKILGNIALSGVSVPVPMPSKV